MLFLIYSMTLRHFAFLVDCYLLRHAYKGCNMHYTSSQPIHSLPSTGELMRMTRPMGEEDRIPRRRCSFFRKRLRVAVCDPWVPGVFSLRDGSDEWAMEAGGVPFHTRSTGGSAPGGGVYSSIQQKEGDPQAICLLCSLHTETRARAENITNALWTHTHRVSWFFQAAKKGSNSNSQTKAALWHDSWLCGFLESLLGPFLPMLHRSQLSEFHRKIQHQKNICSMCSISKSDIIQALQRTFDSGH